MIHSHDTAVSYETALMDVQQAEGGVKEPSRPLSWAERAARAPQHPSNSPAKQTPSFMPSARRTPNPPETTSSDKSALPPVPAFAIATKDKPVIVLDAGALLRAEALDRYRQTCTFITTAEAAQEVRDAMARQRLGERYLDIQTVQPTVSDLKWAEKFAGMTGDLPFLSGTDLGLIALTYMLQRATGQTERLKLQPPAYECFNGVELQNKFESTGNTKLLWTLQRENLADRTLDREEDCEESVEDGATCGDELVAGADGAKSTRDYAESDEDLHEEEGWVTEEALRNHLGLVSTRETSECRSYSEANDDAAGDAEKHSDAFIGLELRAHLQDGEDLVSCMTTDFSIQNVLLQMGLGVLAVDGKKIRTVKVWALLCRACGHVERKTKLLFCLKCGHHTLDRAPLYFDQSSGKVYIFDGRKKFSKRGQVYCIPKGTGGKHSRPIILAADQLLMGGLYRELRHKEKLWKKDVEAKNPFSPNYCLEAQSWHLRAYTASGRAAAPTPPKVVVGLGPGNPNSNRWMKHRTRKYK